MVTELLKGFAVTFKHIFKKAVTVQYPEERPRLMPRFRGALRLTRHDDGKERCIGCYLCSAVCPTEAISLRAGMDEGGRRYAREYYIDFTRCAFCGFCVEACPVSALEMTHRFELAEEDIARLRYDKGSLLALAPAPLIPSPLAGMDQRMGEGS